MSPKYKPEQVSTRIELGCVECFFGSVDVSAHARGDGSSFASVSVTGAKTTQTAMLTGAELKRLRTMLDAAQHELDGVERRVWPDGSDPPGGRKRHRFD